MNGYQFILIMNDLMMDIKLGMRLTNPNKGLSRLKSQYQQMLDFQIKQRLVILAEAVVSIIRDKLNEDFVAQKNSTQN